MYEWPSSLIWELVMAPTGSIRRALLIVPLVREQKTGQTVDICSQTHILVARCVGIYGINILAAFEALHNHCPNC